MKKIIILLVLLSNLCFVYGQNYIVNYKTVSKSNPFENQRSDNQGVIQFYTPDTEHTLILNGNIQSVFYTQPSEIEQEVGALVLGFSSGEEFFIYKNLPADIYFQKAAFLTEQFLVYDSIPQLDWKITEEKEKIGSYECIKATAMEGEKNITAWFTDELPIANGPFRYGGLPGLILKLEDQTSITLVQKIEPKGLILIIPIPIVARNPWER